MFPLNSSPLGSLDSRGLNQIRRNIELHDADVAELRSFSIEAKALPRLRPGEVIQLSSEGSSVFRRVERIETIAGECIVIWLDPRHAGATDTRADQAGNFEE